MKLIVSILCCFPLIAKAQFAPQAPQTGHEGIRNDSNIIINWATNCSVQRGWMDAADTSQGKASSGLESNAVGNPSQNAGVVSLGDGGIATLTFAASIRNGNGFDFVIFENAFSNPTNAAEGFLELAFVEVSSDGEHFIRFPAVSNTPVTQQIGPFAYLNASYLNNLAGKYIHPFGTAFDLEDLADSSNININAITHVRIIDVVGAINTSIGSKDSQGNLINDPYPTAFATGGFDLSAVGVIHQNVVSIPETKKLNVQIFPNPTSQFITINTTITENYTLQLYNQIGQLISQKTSNYTSEVSLENLAAGIYFIKISASNFSETHKIIKQ